MAFLDEASIPRPTTLIHSGNGLYLQWRLPKPFDFASDTDRDYFAALSRRFHDFVIAAGRKLRRWKFDHTGDLARVTRVPGSWNHKTRPAKPVLLLEHNPELTFTLATLKQIAEDLERRFKPAVPTTPARTKKPQTKPATDEAESPQPQLESVGRGVRGSLLSTSGLQTSPSPSGTVRPASSATVKTGRKPSTSYPWLTRATSGPKPSGR